ncbi:hypothetical protein FRB99_006247 [Tulasnella sp. 403]|nr:hypothetical protein FRB99_006247 [Tulasnella sp. 403]
MRIPAALMPSIPGGQTPYNLLLRSYNGSISAKLLLSSQTPSKSLLFAESHNGKVMLVITARQNQRFNLSATSQNGAVVVYIPRDFQGPVAFRNGNGKTTFSEAIKPHLTPFGRDRDTGKVFIGDWETSGYGDETADHNAWPGDELDLVSHNGNIKVYYSDEPIKPSTSELFWKDVMTYGPIGGVVQTVKRNINRAMTNATRDEHPGYTTSYYPDKKDKTSSTDQTSSTVKPPSSDKIPPFGDFKS